jgi:transposase
MRLKGSADFLSDRRRRALRLLSEALSLSEVARRIGCAVSSVMRWRNAWRRRGEDALRVRVSPGRPRQLTAVKERRLVRILLQGAIANGYRTDLWTTQRIAEIVEKRFGVRYHRSHIARLMHRINWSHQKPERRAVERDEEAIARWRRRDWPRVKKTPSGWAPTSSS